jgi:hypothetical protein
MRYINAIGESLPTFWISGVGELALETVEVQLFVAGHVIWAEPNDFAPLPKCDLQSKNNHPSE